MGGSGQFLGNFEWSSQGQQQLLLTSGQDMLLLTSGPEPSFFPLALGPGPSQILSMAGPSQILVVPDLGQPLFPPPPLPLSAGPEPSSFPLALSPGPPQILTTAGPSQILVVPDLGQPLFPPPPPLLPAYVPWWSPLYDFYSEGATPLSITYQLSTAPASPEGIVRAILSGLGGQAPIQVNDTWFIPDTTTGFGIPVELPPDLPQSQRNVQWDSSWDTLNTQTIPIASMPPGVIPNLWTSFTQINQQSWGPLGETVVLPYNLAFGPSGPGLNQFLTALSYMGVSPSQVSSYGAAQLQSMYATGSQIQANLSAGVPLYQAPVPSALEPAHGHVCHPDLHSWQLHRLRQPRRPGQRHAPILARTALLHVLFSA